MARFRLFVTTMTAAAAISAPVYAGENDLIIYRDIQIIHAQAISTLENSIQQTLGVSTQSLSNAAFLVRDGVSKGGCEALNRVLSDSGYGCERDSTVSIFATPNDPFWRAPSLETMYGSGNADVETNAHKAGLMNTPTAWDTTTGCSNVVVAVIDTGVQYNHPDLAANMWTNPGEIPGNGIDDDANGFVDDVYGADFLNNDGDPMDDNNHGTHCAGTIAAVGNNGVGVAGVAWNARIMALKFLGASGSGSTSGAIQAIAYAASKGAIISNNSWGGPGYSHALANAVQGTTSTLFVAAAGNENNNNDVSPRYPANNAAGLAHGVVVGAINRATQRASFSNFGTNTVDIAAPGVQILSTLTGSSYGWLSGTSMATPQVAGAAALLKCRKSDATPAQMKTAIVSSGTAISNFPLRSGKMLNVAAALTAINSEAPSPTPTPTPTPPQATPTPTPTPTPPGGGEDSPAEFLEIYNYDDPGADTPTIANGQRLAIEARIAANQGIIRAHVETHNGTVFACPFRLSFRTNGAEPLTFTMRARLLTRHPAARLNRFLLDLRASANGAVIDSDTITVAGSSTAAKAAPKVGMSSLPRVARSQLATVCRNLFLSARLLNN